VAEFDHKAWYYWPCQAYPGAFSMAADHFLARGMGDFLDRPVLRFFTWEPYCISLGYHQKAGEIDLDKCRNENIDVVRRPTGGRAILHAEELTYSVIYPFQSLDVAEFYRLIHLPFVEALRNLGVPAQFKASQADFRTFYRSDNSSACFATSAKYEVEIDGKKLIGSAQRVYDKAILQHGSLLIGPFHQQLVDFLYLDKEKRERMRDYISEHTAHVWQYSPGLSAADLEENIQQQFTKAFDLDFLPIGENYALAEKIRSFEKKAEFRLNYEEAKLESA